jgi:molecular chaperone GrpE
MTDTPGRAPEAPARPGEDNDRQAAAPDAANPPSVAAGATAANSAEAAAGQPDPLETARAEAAELRDKLLRTLAEMENLRKRTEREVADARSYGIAAFARDLLGIADNMRRALETTSAEARAAADQTINALIDGVELTERELLKVLEKNGVRKFDPFGEKFDPNLHQAMFEIPDSSVPAGTVVQVVQAGYMIGERVLRPAMVAIAKGGPKAAPANGEARNAEALQANDNAASESDKS